MDSSEQITPPFAWDKARIDAAEALALGELSTEQIATNAGVCRTTLWNWRQHPEFQAHVNRRLEELGVEARRRGLAVLNRRVAALNDRWNRLRRVLEARADDPDMLDVPGGSTGLLVKTVKVRSNADGEIEKTIEAEVDVALLKELREHEKQAAQELGQWIERAQVEQTTKAYVTVGPDDL